MNRQGNTVRLAQTGHVLPKVRLTRSAALHLRGAGQTHSTISLPARVDACTARQVAIGSFKAIVLAVQLESLQLGKELADWSQLTAAV